jgi:hypothetical protein
VLADAQAAQDEADAIVVLGGRHGVTSWSEAKTLFEASGGVVRYYRR